MAFANQIRFQSQHKMTWIVLQKCDYPTLWKCNLHPSLESYGAIRLAERCYLDTYAMSSLGDQPFARKLTGFIWTLWFLAVLTVGLRVFVRSQMKAFWWDDSIILLCFVRPRNQSGLIRKLIEITDLLHY